MATGASEVARALRAHGVSTVFALCGDHTNPILESCDDEQIRIVDARDERGAAWMAAGWALATAEPGVVVVSNTPALTNAATALADSTFSGIPVVCITGGVALSDRGKGHPGDQDQAAIAEPISKWSVLLENPEEASVLISRSCQIAVAPRPGAVVVELPMDVQQSRVERGVEELSLRTSERDAETPNVSEIARLLGSAERPVISEIHPAGQAIEITNPGDTPVDVGDWEVQVVPDDESFGATISARLRFPGRDHVFVLYLSVLMVPMVVLLIPRFLIINALGWVDTYAGLISTELVSVWGIFLLRQFFVTLPRDLEDAARLDGAGEWTVFWRVVLPLSKPALATLAVFAFVDQWKSFLWPLIATRSAEMRVVEVGIASFHGLYYTNWPYQMAAAVTAVLPLLVVYFVAQRYFVGRIQLTGLK